MKAFRRILPFSSGRGSRPDALALSTPMGMSRGSTPRNASNARRRRSRYCARPGLELMEELQLMSTIPVFETVNVANGSLPTVQIAPMEQTVVNGSLNTTTNSDKVQVNLQAGEILTAGLNVQYPEINANWGSSVEVYNPSGQVVAAQSTNYLTGQTATDPQSGIATYDNSIAFRAATTGTYTVEVDENAFLADYIFGAGTYSLTLRPVTLDNSALTPEVNAQDAAKLQYSGGGLYAFLDANDDALTFTGPTGRGFEITGQFSEVTTNVPGSALSTSTITGTGTLTLQSGLGAIPLPLPPGLELVVTTDANGYNGLFGEVASAQIQFPYESVISDLVDPLGSAVGPYIDQANTALGSLGASISIPHVSLGIGLGEKVASIVPGAPVNPAVPYLYFSASSGFAGTLGTATVSIAGYSGSIVVDPADPSLYVDVVGIPGLNEVSFAVSQHGYIPFTPTVTPSNSAGQTLYGDVAVLATLNIGDLSEDLVPLTLTGGYDINFATNGGSWTAAVEQDVVNLFSGNPSLSDLNNIALGVNEEAGISLGFAKVGSLQFPLVGGTVIFNGPQQVVDFAGSTINPFANTPLAFLDSGSFSYDGYLNENGQFNIDLQGSFGVLGYQIASASLDVDNYGVYANGQINFLGETTTAYAWFDYSGDFDIWGSVNFNYYADLTGGSGFGVSGGIGATIYFNFDNYGDVDLSVSGDVYGNVWFFGQSVAWYDKSAYFNVDTNLNNLWNGLYSACYNELVSNV